MPWTAADAKKYKKGLSPKQARQWSAVANSALAACQKKKGKNCEASAIRQANSAVGAPAKKEHEMTMQVKDETQTDAVNTAVPVIGLEVNDKQENKEQDHEKMYNDHSIYVPYGVVSFSELQAYYEAREQAKAVLTDAEAFYQIVHNIMNSDEVDNKEAMLDKLAKEFSARAKTGASLHSMIKEQDEEQEFKETWTEAYVDDLPDSAFLWVDSSSGSKDKDNKTAPRSCRYFPIKDKNGNVDLPHLRNALSELSQNTVPMLKGDARDRVKERAERMLERGNKELSYWREEETKSSNVLDKVTHAFNSALVSAGLVKAKEVQPVQSSEDSAPSSPPMLVWKEKDGTWRWLARYSNNFRDDDFPPEIISEKSHRRFVEMVDKGEAPYPELWLWHIPEWRLGQADWVAYDDSGFALAAGAFDKGKEVYAEWLSTKEDYLVSHGMPQTHIERDPDDPSVLVKHTTREVSPLPGYAAANKLTGFLVLGDNEMAIPAQKKQALVRDGLSEDLLSALEDKNKKDADKATAEGTEKKEKDEQAQEQTAQVEAAETTSETTSEEQTSETTDETGKEKPLTRQEIADGFAAVMNPWMKSVEDRLDQLAKEIGSVKQDDEEKIKEQVNEMPTASFAAMMSKSIVGRKETEVGDGDSLKDKRPAETKAAVPSKTGIRWIDSMLAETAPEQQ